jgi:hypothetical protein
MVKGFNSTYHPSLDDPNVWVPYRYHPTKVGATIFIILFSLTTLFHVFQIFKKRTWYFIPLLIGGICTFLSVFLQIDSILTDNYSRVNRLHWQSDL